MLVSNFSILDRKSMSFGPIFQGPNVDVAKRSIISSLSKDNQMVLYPADFTLVHLSDFDTETGETIKFSGSFYHEVAQLVDLIPDKFKQFALDGSFPNGNAVIL